MVVLRDFGRFLWAVVSRWQAYTTGSLVTAFGFFYEHLTGKMIPGNYVLWGAGLFFVTGSFMAWREEYQSDRPIEIRDRLDTLTRKGNRLVGLWMSRGRPAIRTRVWERAALRFVRQHFTMVDNDSFRSHYLSAADSIGVALHFVDSTSETNTSESYKPVTLLKSRLEALSKLRNKIRD